MYSYAYPSQRRGQAETGLLGLLAPSHIQTANVVIPPLLRCSCMHIRLVVDYQARCKSASVPPGHARGFTSHHSGCDAAGVCEARDTSFMQPCISECPVAREVSHCIVQATIEPSCTLQETVMQDAAASSCRLGILASLVIIPNGACRLGCDRSLCIAR